jgi:small subunit ribosomal protein S18
MSSFNNPLLKNLPVTPPERLDGKNAPRIDYKDTVLLQKFVSSQGKMLSTQRTAVSAKKQRILAREIKRARFLALMKYCG